METTSKVTKVADWILVPVYAKVLDVPNGYISDKYQVRSPMYLGDTIYISKGIVEEFATNANYVEKEEKVNKHTLASKLVYSNGKPFTVVFKKEDGSNRELIGYLHNTDTLLGSSTVVDLEKFQETGKVQFRIIYHHKLVSIIVDGTKYKI